MNRQQKLKQRQKQDKAMQRKVVKMADEAATEIYAFAIEQAKTALRRMGFGDIRLKRFDETLEKVEQDYGLYRRD